MNVLIGVARSSQHHRLTRQSVIDRKNVLLPSRVYTQRYAQIGIKNTTRTNAVNSRDSDSDLSPSPSPDSLTPESARQLLDELLDPEKFGTRGEAWFLAQSILILLVLFPPSAFRQIVDTLGGCFLIAGLALISLGGFNLGTNLTPVPKPRDSNHSLVTEGIYSLCRHPMYGGIIVSSAGLALFTGDEARLAFAGLMFLVLDQKAAVEEEYLEEKYPGEYAKYKTSGVKKLIPWLY